MSDETIYPRLADLLADVAALRAERDEALALLQDAPSHADMDATMFEINVLAGQMGRLEAAVAALRAERDALQSKLDSMAVYSHETVRGAVQWRDERIAELERERDRLREALDSCIALAEAFAGIGRGWDQTSHLLDKLREITVARAAAGAGEGKE